MSRNWKKNGRTGKVSTVKSNWFADVPGLGNVALTRSALAQISKCKVSDQQLWDALYHGHDVDGTGAALRQREKDGITVSVNMNPTPFKDANLIIGVTRVRSG